MIVQLDSENADLNLTSQVTVLTDTPDASNPMICQGLICFGDGTKNLDGTGGTFELTVTVGGQTIEPDPQEMEFSAAVRAAVWTTPFPVPANSEVILKAKSPNGADTDVDVTAYLYDVSAQGALVLNNLDHVAKVATGSSDMTNEVVDNTVLSRLLANGDTSDFDPSTDGLQLIRDGITSAHATTDSAISNVNTTVQNISNVTRLSGGPSKYMERGASDIAYMVEVALKDMNGDMEDPDGPQLAITVYNPSGTSRDSLLYKEAAFTNALDSGTGTFSAYKKMERSAEGIYVFYIKIASDATEEQLIFKFGWEEAGVALYEFKTGQVVDAANDLTAILTQVNKMNFTGTDVKATLDSEKVQVSGIDADAISAAAIASAAVTKIQNGLSTSAALAIVDAIVDAIKLKTDLIPASPAAVGSKMDLDEDVATNTGKLLSRAAGEQDVTASGDDRIIAHKKLDDPSTTAFTETVDADGNVTVS